MLGPRLAAALCLWAAVAGGCGRKGEHPHARVACVGCHRGTAADAGRAPVPSGACASSRCHPDGGPDSARLAMVVFGHRDHGRAPERLVPCASCHTHERGNPVIKPDTSACALCHFAQLVDAREPSCTMCHLNPRHTRTTSQGVPISHAQLDAAHVPCTRCHYQLVEGSTAVPTARCATCHGDTTVTAVTAPDTLHPAHRGLTCSACHQPVRHRVVAMSSSVELVCTDCHVARHRRSIPADTSATARCQDCHTGVHAEEQRLILGLLPGEPIRPSPMFVGGVTCRSCHVAPGGPGPRTGAPLRANEAACTGCHGPSWSGILAMWRRGYARREEWVSAYIRGAEATFGDSAVPAVARARVRQARGLLGFLRAAGPLHNLPASDRIMRHALTLVTEAYEAAALVPPAAPELGPPVAMGSCISCHYGVEEVRSLRDSATGRPMTHADHLFRAHLPCDACHAVGAAPPGLPDSLWLDTTRVDRGGPRARRRS